VEIPVPEEFADIARQIIAEGRTDDEWAEIESDDMFQSPSFVGGYDAVEGAFCFSYFDQSRNEYWFQLELSELKDLAAGRPMVLDLRPAE
jgi:hypothetical protein